MKNLETLETINLLEEASAGEIAKKLNIKESAFSNRARRLLKDNLIKKRASGKKQLYSLTDSGMKLLHEKETPENTVDSSLMRVLERLLENSFDGAYRFIDIFFEKPLCSLTNHYMQEILKITLWEPLFMELCRELQDFIHIASAKNYTKDQFADHLLSIKVYSNEMKGFIYYIANKYEVFRGQQRNVSD